MTWKHSIHSTTQQRLLDVNEKGGNPPNTHSTSTSTRQSQFPLKCLLPTPDGVLTDAAKLLFTEVTALHCYNLVSFESSIFSRKF